MLFALVLVSLGAGPVKSLAAPGFSIAGVDAAKASFFQDHLAHELTARGLKVVTEREVTMLLGMERQRQLLTCGEDSAKCSVEIASALGVDGLLLGSIAKLDDLLILEAKVISATDGHNLGAFSARADKESDLLSQLDTGAATLARRLLGEAEPAAVVTAPTARGLPRWVGWATIGVGGVLVATSAIFANEAERDRRSLNPITGTISIARGMELRDSGMRNQTFALGLGIGAGVVVVAGALLAWAPWRDATVRAALGPDGAGMVISGSFP